MTFADDIREVFARHYKAPRRPRDYCRLCGELADFSVEMDAQSEWMFTIEEWEADAEVVQAEAEAAKAQNGRPTSP